MQIAHAAIKEYTPQNCCCAFITGEHFYPGGRNEAYLAACHQEGGFVLSCDKTTTFTAGMFVIIDGKSSFTISTRRGGRVLLLPVLLQEHNSLLLPQHLNAEGKQILDGLAFELVQRKPGFQAVVAGLVTRLLGETVAQQPGPRPLRMEDIRAFIEANSANSTLKTEAEHFYYHPNTPARFVRRSCGVPFTALSRTVRLEKAANLLIETGVPVYRVAELCGYRNLTHFYNLFFNMFEKTPDQFRRSAQ